MKTITRSMIAGAMHVSGLSGLCRRWHRRSLVILNYHRVLPEEERAAYPFPDLAVTPDTLTQHVRFCSRWYTCLPLREALARLRSADSLRRPILVFTFDDGYRDNHKYAMPILDAHGVRATFFVIGSLVGTDATAWYDRLGRAVAALHKASPTSEEVLAFRDDEAGRWIASRWRTHSGDSPWRVVRDAKALDPTVRATVIARFAEAADRIEANAGGEWDRIMTAEQLAQLGSQGHEIGSHTRSHPILTQLAPNAIEEELIESRNRLREWTGQEVTSLAYPNGDFNEVVVAKARQAGYQQAVTTLPGLNNISRDPFRLRRIFMTQHRLRRPNGSASPSLLELELCGAAETLFFRRRRRGGIG